MRRGSTTATFDRAYFRPRRLTPASPRRAQFRDFNLLIFDCDGVLVDSEVLSCKCLVDVLSRYGTPITLDYAFENFLGRSATAVAEYFLARTGGALPDRFGIDLYHQLALSFEASLKLIPHIRSVLDGIDRTCCVASSSDAKRLCMTLSVVHLEMYFGDRIYTSASVKRSKPAPDLFLFAAEQMNATPPKTLVIEDSVNGVLAGKAAGMTVWGFTGGSHYLGRDGHRLLSDAGADFVFDSMAALAN